MKTGSNSFFTELFPYLSFFVVVCVVFRDLCRSGYALWTEFREFLSTPLPPRPFTVNRGFLLCWPLKAKNEKKDSANVQSSWSKECIISIMMQKEIFVSGHRQSQAARSVSLVMLPVGGWGEETDDISDKMGRLSKQSLMSLSRESLDLQISSSMGYFKKTNAFLVYAKCFHETVQDKRCWRKCVW